MVIKQQREDGCSAVYECILGNHISGVIAERAQGTIILGTNTGSSVPSLLEQKIPPQMKHLFSTQNHVTYSTEGGKILLSFYRREIY